MDRRQLLLLAAAAPFGRALAASGYPSQTIRLVAPYAPGGTVDILSRQLAEPLRAGLGQSVIVENRGGAGGTLGADAVAKARPDGYTILFGAVHHAIAQSVYPKLGYDIREMSAVGFLGRVNHALIVNKDLPAGNVAELVRLLKADPEKYSYATPGAGTMQHLMAEYFKSVTGTRMMHVPYRGSAPAIVDIIAGNVHMMFETMPSAIQHIRAGSVRAIAVTSKDRSASLPDVPTAAESGAENYDATSWYGIYAPPGTPADTVASLNRAINGAFADAPFARRWGELGADAGGGTPAELAQLTRAEVARWAQVARNANIKVG
ncbi:Bug family tripartite tricarboxylate transporter substrate binding protein [Achromobacter xylosoxidans]|uniref:Bug family tripartite tricarboxylate transporter substrate binding protein n=1 Tax=Alcaligenes xylosoxydans xylosoxydans TaxID=85698 RepID=UPI001EEA9540|nr:tripartite tricarboxylate transporter substrate binding protein [Achromobacter xylosoxidans]